MRWRRYDNRGAGLPPPESRMTVTMEGSTEGQIPFVGGMGVSPNAHPNPPKIGGQGVERDMYE